MLSPLRNDIYLITGELEENLFCFPTRRIYGWAAGKVEALMPQGKGVVSGKMSTTSVHN
jgi:hypothetical protein